MKKFIRILSFVLAFALLFSVCSFTVSAKNDFDATAKVTDYRAWSQDQLPWATAQLGKCEEYGTFNYYGCLMVAFAKIAVQSGARTVKTIDPGKVNEIFTKNGRMNSSGEVVNFSKAAPLIGLTYEGKITFDEILPYLKKTNKKYVVIVKNSGHYMAIDRDLSIKKNAVYFLESWKSRTSKMSTSKSETENAHSTRYTTQAKYLEMLANKKYLDSYTKYGTTVHLFSVPSVPSYVVTLNANGGSCNTSSVSAYKNQSFYSSLPTPTRKGYSFLGWYTQASGGTKVTSSNAKTSKAITLYAQWSAASYTVTFDRRDGNTNPCKSVKYGATYGDLPTPTRSGYTFLGWYTQTSGGTKVSSSTKVTNAQNHTLYAQWKAKSHTHSYSGGICDVCNYEYEYKITALSAQTYQVSNSSGASIWARPYSGKSKKLTTLKKGSVVVVTGKTTNQPGNLWYKLSDGSWVYSGNVKKVTNVPSSNIRYVTGTDGSLYINKTASSKYRLTTMPEGAACVINSKKSTGNWIYVTYNGVSGYAYKSYLTSTAPTTSYATAPKALTIRAKASSSGKSLGKVPAGAKVVVYKKSGSWKWICYNGVAGYVTGI